MFRHFICCSFFGRFLHMVVVALKSPVLNDLVESQENLALLHGGDGLGWDNPVPDDPWHPRVRARRQDLDGSGQVKVGQCRAHQGLSGHSSQPVGCVSQQTRLLVQKLLDAGAHVDLRSRGSPLDKSKETNEQHSSPAIIM